MYFLEISVIIFHIKFIYYLELFLITTKPPKISPKSLLMYFNFKGGLTGKQKKNKIKESIVNKRVLYE